MISPGRSLKNLFPGTEFTIALVKNPDTFTTPESSPVATFSDIFVIFFTLNNTKSQNFQICTNPTTLYRCHCPLYTSTHFLIIYYIISIITLPTQLLHRKERQTSNKLRRFPFLLQNLETKFINLGHNISITKAFSNGKRHITPQHNFLFSL